jgi:hypothetical protein
MTKLENIKAAIAEGNPVVATLEGKASTIIGYDDEKQSFWAAPCGGPRTWIPYSALEEEKRGVKNDFNL